MTNSSIGTSLSQAALVAGFGLVAMTVVAIGAIYFIFPAFVVPDDAAATANNIIADETLFRIGIASLAIVAILDVLVAWALYVYLEPVNRSLSLLVAWFRLIYAAILSIALFNYANVLQLLSGAEYLKGFKADKVHMDMMLSINAFDDGWAIGLIFFGLHIALLGFLILKSDYVPRILGFVLIAAGLAYMVDSFGSLILPNYNFAFSTYVGWGELLLMFWLLLKGRKVQSPSKT